MGVVQENAVTVDRSKTIQALRDFLSTRAYDELLENEVQWLESMNISMVLMDAPFLPAVAAKQSHIPSIMISNFCFDHVCV